MSINNNDTLIKETPESFLKNYVNDLSLFNVYKNHVDKLIVEASVKIKNNVHIYDRYVVCIMVNEVSFKKIYDFIDDLFKNGLIDPCHLSRARDFIDKYYLLNEGFVVGVDNGAYKIYSDMDDTAICLYMNKKDHYYKFYKKVKYSILKYEIELAKKYFESKGVEKIYLMLMNL